MSILVCCQFDVTQGAGDTESENLAIAPSECQLATSFLAGMPFSYITEQVSQHSLLVGLYVLLKTYDNTTKYEATSIVYSVKHRFDIYGLHLQGHLSDEWKFLPLIFFFIQLGSDWIHKFDIIKDGRLFFITEDTVGSSTVQGTVLEMSNLHIRFMTK